ncbi:unnamed protein product, partial [Rotaria sp. Silwood2]
LATLEPVVYDLFLVRVNTDNTELEVQRIALRLLTIIVNSVRNEDDKWKHLSRQIVDVLLVHLQSYVTIVLFDAVSSVELRPIDPFVIAFRAFTKQFRTIVNNFRHV